MYREKKDRHEPAGLAMLKRCWFDEKENKLDYYRGKDLLLIGKDLRFIDSFRFMNFSLSDLVDNLPGRIFNRRVCTKCMEREKSNLECCFVGLKSD